jgi:hypothetical protein
MIATCGNTVRPLVKNDKEECFFDDSESAKVMSENIPEQDDAVEDGCLVNIMKEDL